MADSSTPLLDVANLSVTLAGDAGAVRVLDSLSFTVAESEVVDIVGPSGSGKSTFLRALAQLLPGATGSLTLRGTPASSMAATAWRCAVTLLPQKPVGVPGSVRDNLLLPWRFKVRDDDAVPEERELVRALDVLGMEDVSLDRDASRLSVGQLGRLGFARVWLTSPDVLLLDEAEASLDDVSADAMSRAISRFAREGGRASKGFSAGVVRVRHRASDGLASRRLRLADGRLEEVGA